MFGLRIKDLKKRLKRNRRPVWSLGLFAALIAGAAILGTLVSRHYVNEMFASPERGDSLPVWSDKLPVTYDPADSLRGETLTALSKWSGEVELVLHRTYLCGSETRQLGRHTTAEAMDLLKAHREWSAAFDPIGRVVFEEAVDDLSPACSKSATISVDREGNLSLFDGSPRKEKVMRTFFQLDVKSLESSLSKEQLKELADGIRVTDRAEFNSVLSSFSDYALPPAKDVIKPAE